MIQDFKEWSASRTFTNHFSDLNDTVVAIDASFYLERLLTVPPSKEPLLSALGGLPFSLRIHVQNELDALHAANITPVFVFAGLESGRPHDPFAGANSVARANEAAWELYNAHEADRAVEAFGTSGYSVPVRFYSLLQEMLLEAGITFQVAPYSALGQLAYLARNGREYVDAIAGPSELLLYDVDTVITGLNFETHEFTFIKRQHCMEELGGINADMFIDACMLSGCSLMPTLPSLTTTTQRPRGGQKVRQALDLLRSNGHTGYSVCVTFQEDPQMKKIDYLDRFKRSRMALKHQVVLGADGKVAPFEPDLLPNDLHEIIGQRLPDEIYYYLSQGAVGPSVLNKLALGQICEVCPPDGGDSETYRQLVASKLSPLRTSALALVASYLFRSYQHRPITLTCWFATDRPTELNLMEVPSAKSIVGGWLVRQTTMDENLGLKSGNASLKACALSLTDAAFAGKTKTVKSKDKPRPKLVTVDEIKANTIWRFLHMREYVAADHTLTPWGKVLATALGAMPADLRDARTFEDAVVLAVELIRHDLLSSETMFPSYTGQPLNGSESDKKNCLLLSRVACLLRLRHKNIGFTGPLSRHLLGFGSALNALRSSLRDLADASLLSVLLGGDAVKDAPGLASMAASLPLRMPTDVGLGIAMKHYLDDLVSLGNPTSAETKEAARSKAAGNWFPHAEDYNGDLELCFCLWDAIHAGVKVAATENLIKDADQWAAVDKWAQERR